MAWIIIGAGPMGTALGFEGIQRGLGTPLFVERQERVAEDVVRCYSDAGISIEVAQDLGELDLGQIAPEVVFFAAGWSAIREVFFGALATLGALKTPPVVMGLGSARLTEDERNIIDRTGLQVLLGTGLEPGFVEATISDLAARGDDYHSITTFCGGVPCTPQPPLFFQSQFGSRPHFGQRKTYRREDGEPVISKRFTGAEPIFFPGVGLMEAFDDAMSPDTACDDRIGVPNVAQKSLRWPGYAEKLSMLHELGLLKDSEITVDGTAINIARTVETVICKSGPEDHSFQILFAYKAIASSGKAAELFLVCNSPASHVGVTPMGRMTAIPAIAAYQQISSENRTGLFLPSDPALAAIADVSLHRLKESGGVQVLQNSTTVTP